MNFELLRHLAAEGLNEAALLALDESDLKELTNPDNSPLRPLQVLALKSHLRTRHIDATPSEASVDYIAPRPRMESSKSEVEELKAQIARLENAFAAKTGEGQWQGSRMQADEVFRTKLPAERRFGEMEQQLRESAAQASQWMVERDRLMAMHLAQVEHLAAGKAEAERRAAEAEQLLRQSVAETAELKEERDQLAIHLAELKRNTEPMNLQTWPTAKTVSAEKNTTPAPAHGQSEAGQKAAERRVIAILMNGSELWRKLMLESVVSSAEFLDLSGHALGLVGAKLLAEVLLVTRTIRIVNLAGCDIWTACASGDNHPLGMTLMKRTVPDAADSSGTTITTTAVAVQTLHANNTGGKALAEALMVNETVHTISFCGANFAIFGSLLAELLAEALVVNKTIHTINLSNTNAGDKGAKALAAIFQSNKSLRTIRLGGNGITNAGFTVLAVALASQSTVEDIDLRGNNIQAEVAKPLIEKLRSMGGAWVYV